jgi:hypothetical protein
MSKGKSYESSQTSTKFNIHFQPSMELLLFTERPSPRFCYIADLLFGTLLPCRYRITTDRADFLRPGVARISYGRQRVAEAAVFLPAGPLLHEDRIRPVHLDFFSHRGLPAFFQKLIPGADLPFDLPAMIFFLVSRYEEYLPFEADRHGRFPAQASAASRGGFLETPLVDRWALRLAGLLQQKFPEWTYRKRRYRFLPTYDIDLAWAYRHREAWLQVAGSLKSLLLGRLAELGLRWRVLTGQRPDPYFTFPYLDELHRRHGLHPRYFFLLSDGGRYDRSIAHYRSPLQELIRQHAEKYDIGIHPSYRAGDMAGQLYCEVKRLREISGQPTTASRQHYLRLHLPETCRRLLQAGIRHDFTMGYADATGFRASMATPFPWYDLGLEKPTDLIIHPFQAMDATMKWYMNLTPDQARQRLELLIDRTRAVDGVFCSLWHNSSFSDVGGWSPWKQVYEDMIKRAK